VNAHELSMMPLSLMGCLKATGEREPMMQTEDGPYFEKRVRLQVYAHFVTTGRAPTNQEVASALSCSFSEVQDAYRRLAAGKAMVLQTSGEVLMAEPFSAVPTPFIVEIGAQSWWGNCIWDALGIAAMLGQDARVVTACGCCSEAMTLEVRDGILRRPYAGVVHFAIPARAWWTDVVFT
jgi:hypothetical protein